MTDLDDMRAQRDRARDAATALEQQCAMRDEALAELRETAERLSYSAVSREVVRILDALAARLSAHLFPTDEGEAS